MQEVWRSVAEIYAAYIYCVLSFVEDGLTNKAMTSLQQVYPILIEKHATIQSLYWGKGLPFRQIGMAVWY